MSIIVISGDHRQVRRWEARRWWIKAGLTGLALLVVTLSATTVGFFYYWQGYSATALIRVKNAEYDQERAALVARLQSLEAAVEQIDRFAARLQESGDVKPRGVMTEGIGPLSEGLDLSPLPTVNGVQQLSLRGSMVPEEPFTLPGVDGRIESLLDRANEVEGRLGEIYNVKKQRNAFWASLPSYWPVRGWITSQFGPRRATRVGGTRFHEGIDIAAPMGTPVYASGDGVVTFAGYKGGFGRLVIVDHGFGLSTVYGHNAELFVGEGDRVRRGMQIAAIGMTGRTTGPHLHYEVLVDGVPVDPMRYLAQR